jgi:hypothetical protein
VFYGRENVAASWLCAEKKTAVQRRRRNSRPVLIATETCIFSEEKPLLPPKTLGTAFSSSEGKFLSHFFGNRILKTVVVDR